MQGLPSDANAIASLSLEDSYAALGAALVSEDQDEEDEDSESPLARIFLRTLFQEWTSPLLRVDLFFRCGGLIFPCRWTS